MAVAVAAFRRRRRPRARVTAVHLTILGSAIVGALLTTNLKLGLAALLAFLYAPLALIDLGLGLAIWVPLPFLAGISALNTAGKAAGLLVAVIWFTVLGHHQVLLKGVLERHRAIFGAILGLCLWITLSAVWAADPSLTLGDLWHWYVVALIFLIMVCTLRSRRIVQVVVGAFLVGALLSVAYGLAGGVSGSEAANLSAYGGRLGGATGDPNFLAAGVVPALVFAAALLGIVGEMPKRIRAAAVVSLLGSIVVLVVGVIATQSRGGMVAAAVALALAVFAFPAQRRWVVLVILAVLGVGAVTLAVSPGALQRLTSVGNGSGRVGEWTVALRILAAHPVTGAGDANYPAVAHNYTRLPGTLTDARYLVTQPHVAHNTYLQFLSETGLVGFALFVLLAAGCLWACVLAARRFARAGDRAMETLARACFVAIGGVLTAALFISAGVDQRLWVLLALGPVLLEVATSAQSPRDPLRRLRAAAEPSA